jgi:DNA invertase Pin-like site-specific DNA recombinase
MTEPTRAAVYLRVSTRDQSVEGQRQDLRRFIEARGWILADEYTDLGISGARQSRPELDRLMSEAKKRKFDVVLVWRFDRFARSTKHLLDALHAFRDLGIRFVSYQENIDMCANRRGVGRNSE